MQNCAWSPTDLTYTEAIWMTNSIFTFIDNKKKSWHNKRYSKVELKHISLTRHFVFFSICTAWDCFQTWEGSPRIVEGVHGGRRHVCTESETKGCIIHGAAQDIDSYFVASPSTLCPRPTSIMWRQTQLDAAYTWVVSRPRNVELRNPTLLKEPLVQPLSQGRHYLYHAGQEPNLPSAPEGHPVCIFKVVCYINNLAKLVQKKSWCRTYRSAMEHCAAKRLHCNIILGEVWAMGGSRS